MSKKLPEKLVVMGRIVAPFGVKGWIKIEPYTETPHNLCDYKTWWLNTAGAWREIAVEQSNVQNGMVVARLAGCADRDAAAGLKGNEVAVPRAEFPQAQANEFYWADLVGLRVRNTQVQELGTVASVMETGANDVLVVQGERERLIPFITEVVKNVDVAGGVIEVEWGEDF